MFSTSGDYAVEPFYDAFWCQILIIIPSCDFLRSTKFGVEPKMSCWEMYVVTQQSKNADKYSRIPKFVVMKDEQV